LIEFATLDDLQRICDAIGLDHPAVTDAASTDDPQVVHADEQRASEGRVSEPASV
jgi:hypothetical protein